MNELKNVRFENPVLNKKDDFTITVSLKTVTEVEKSADLSLDELRDSIRNVTNAIVATEESLVQTVKQKRQVIDTLTAQKQNLEKTLQDAIDMGIKEKSKEVGK